MLAPDLGPESIRGVVGTTNCFVHSLVLKDGTNGSKDFLCYVTCVLWRVIKKRYRKEETFFISRHVAAKQDRGSTFFNLLPGRLQPLILQAVLDGSQHGVRVQSVANFCRTSNGDQGVCQSRINVFVDVTQLNR